MKTSRHDSGELQALLDLDGTEIELMDGEYFAKLEAHTVEPSPKVPHGIKYSLTLQCPPDQDQEGPLRRAANRGRSLTLRPRRSGQEISFSGPRKIACGFLGSS